MTNTRRFGAAALAALLGAFSMGHAYGASLAEDFDSSVNPGNGWTNGFNDISVGGGDDVANDVPFGLLNTGGNPGDRWTGDGTTNLNYPPNDLLLVNLGNGGTASDHWGGGSITWDAGVAYHTWGDSALSGGVNGLSGDDAIFSTYTVPATGDYDITGVWTENGNAGGANVEILVNGVSIGSGVVDLDIQGDSTTIQSLDRPLAMGDTVSFRTMRQTDYTKGGSARLDAMVIPLIPITLEAFVDRQTGDVTIQNHTGSAVDIIGYTVKSASGALNSGQWSSFFSNDGSWVQLAGADGELSEATLGAETLTTPSSLDLGNVWRQNPENADVQVTVAMADGSVVTVPVEYTGADLNVGDLNFDGTVNSADWALFRAGQGVDMTGMNPYDAYKLGDLNGDLKNDTADFRVFKDVYTSVNAAGAAALFGVPEPASAALVWLATLGGGLAASRGRNG